MFAAQICLQCFEGGLGEVGGGPVAHGPKKTCHLWNGMACEWNVNEVVGYPLVN